jgi:hypothetical protein
MWGVQPRQALHGVIHNGMLGRDAHTPEPVVPVPVFGVVVVPVRGAQVLGRIVERTTAHNPPPGFSRLPALYSLMLHVRCQLHVEWDARPCVGGDEAG